MRTIVRIDKQGKIRPIRRRALDAIPAVEDPASLVALIQALVPLGLQAVGEVLETAVTQLAGDRYSRTGGQPGLVRWGQQQGSVYWLDQKLPITDPRVRDLARKQEVPLATDAQRKTPRTADAGLCRKVLHGLICRRDEAWAEAVPEACGLSASRVSRRFIRASARKWRELNERRLGAEEGVVLCLDGKTFAEDTLVLALGGTRQGEKQILGWVQTATPEQTELALYDAVDSRWWPYVNLYLVTWRQNVCRPVYPRCGECVLRPMCPQVDVTRVSKSSGGGAQP